MPAHPITILPTTFTSANCLPTQHHTRDLRLWGQLDILPNSLKRRLRHMVERLTLRSLATALVDIPAVSMPIAHSLNLRHLCRWVTQLHILVAFIVPSTRCTRVMILLFNELLDITHLTNGWIILAKEKCSINRDVNQFGITRFERNWLILHLWRKVDQHCTCCI